MSLKNKAKDNKYIPYKIIEYTGIDSLKEALKTLDKDFINNNSNKLHINYFESYFNKIKVKTILIDYSYIDKDYLEDFSSYYVRCFSNYKKNCSRLHFFNVGFKKTDFDNLLSGDKSRLNKDILQTSYLGFMVIKPLPKTIIGRTCLKAFPVLNNCIFPLGRTYNINIFGIGLKIDTIAYQEQDSIVAACASTAIWSAFQRTAVIFQHSIPSPVEITKAATFHFPYSNRHFPNKGLTANQMAHAIRNVSLDPFIVDANNYLFLKNGLYAYMKAGIPVVLALELQYLDGKDYISNRLFHAVTITGFSLGKKDSIDLGKNNFFTIASKIDKIYVHDDQVGPYAEMKFNDDKDESLNSDYKYKDFYNDLSYSTRAIPKKLIIPLYHKIRIAYGDINQIIYYFDSIFNKKLADLNIPKMEWDIFLCNVTHFKSDIFKDESLPHDYKLKILSDFFPRFIWRAICIIDNVKRIEFLFDATDIDQGKIYIKSIDWDKNFFNGLKEMAKSISIPKINFIKDSLPLKSMISHLIADSD